MTVNPGIDFLPNIGEWPTPSASGEIALIRRDGDRLIHMMRPRLMDPPPGSMTLTQSPAALAFLKDESAREAIDFRGVPVFTASARIRGIDWRIVDKVDTAEALAPVQLRIEKLALVIAVTILLAALVVAILWFGQRAGLLSFNRRQEQAFAALAHHYETITASVKDAVFLTDAQANLVDANAAAVRQYGYTRAELLKMNARQIRAPETRDAFESQWSPALEGSGVVYQTFHRRKDGTTFPVEISNSAFVIDGVTYTQAFVRDISERRALEQQVARLSRVQRALFHAGGVLLKARNEDELFDETCRILIDDGGYRLADVAVPMHDERKSIRFVTVAGPAAGYVADIDITWGAGPHGVGPTGTALREGITQVNQDFTRNPRVAAWREAATKWGIEASIALPLRCREKVVGVLTIYAEQPNAFDGEELSLLTRFAENISYGLEKLRGTPAG